MPEKGFFVSFAFPWAFLLLIPLAVAVWRMLRRKRSRGVLFADATARFGNVVTWRHRALRVLPYGFLLGCLALIVAAAGPRSELAREVRASEALAVMMAADVSGSMRALDLSEGSREVTRLDAVKACFRDFVDRRPEDLIGLVTFGGYASVRSPLTADHRALLHTLSGVNLPTEDGLDDRGLPVSDDELLTAIGDGLALALLRLQDAEPKTKIVILLSDGESNAGAVTPTEAASAAKAAGVRVYTIGVGKTGRTKVRARDFAGRSVLADVFMTLDEETLKAIAKETGGRYANVRSQEQLEETLRRIGELETTRVEREVYTRYRGQSLPWAVGGGALTALSAALTLILVRRPV